MQADWIGFLKTNEPEFPGITGTARLLWATLAFGLQLMVNVMPPPAGCVLHTGHCFALARFLVHRMLNARAVMLHNAEDARRQQRQEAILVKLADGPQPPPADSHADSTSSLPSNAAICSNS